MCNTRREILNFITLKVCYLKTLIIHKFWSIMMYLACPPLNKAVHELVLYSAPYENDYLIIIFFKKA